MNILQSLCMRKDSRLRHLASGFFAGLSFMLRYNGYTIRFAFYMLPESRYSSDNLRDALQLLD